MEIYRDFDKQEFKFEYGVYGKRLLPWDGLNLPFGGAFCKLPPGETSLEHTNEPSDELELFICLSGESDVYIGDKIYPAKSGDIFSIPKQINHYVKNTSNDDFTFYAIWWNQDTVSEYTKKCKETMTESSLETI